MILGGGGTCRGACAACKFQRRRCAGDCPLAPYFPAEKPEVFQQVHRRYGVRTIVKILENIDEDLKPDAMKSIIFESYVRDRSPVHGCLGITHHLQYMLWLVEEELKAVNSYLELCRSQQLTGDNNHNENIGDIYKQEDVVNNNNQSNLGTPLFSPLSVSATQQQQPHMYCPYGYSEMNNINGYSNNLWGDQKPFNYDNNGGGGGGGFSNNNGVMAIQSQLVNLQMESNHNEQEDDDIRQFLEVSEDKQSFVDSKEANASSSGESSKEPIDEPERRN